MTVLTQLAWLFVAAAVTGSLTALIGPELKRSRDFKALPYHVPADGRRGQ